MYVISFFSSSSSFCKYKILGYVFVESRQSQILLFLFCFVFVHTWEGRKWELIQKDVSFLSLLLPLYATPLVNCRNLITNGSKFSWNCPLTAFITAIPCYRKMTRTKLLDPKSQWKVQRIWYRTCMQVGKWRHSCANLARSQLFLTATLNVLTRTSPFVRS